MSYTEVDFKTIKAVKEGIAKEGFNVRCYNPGLGGDLSNHTGSVTLEGPHYPKPHKWYGSGMMENGILISIE